MSEVTLAQLLDADASAFDDAAQAWRGLAEDLDAATECFIRESRDLESAWREGAGAETARTQNGSLRSKISNAEDPARRTGEALRMLAGSIRELRGLAWRILESAQRDGYVVDTASGQVTVMAGRHQDTPADQLRRAMQGYADEVRQVVERARAVDDWTVQLINMDRPDPADGFGCAPRRALTREEVERQRSRSPGSVGQWWDELTPEQQEQAIRDFPELVGWLDGVPVVDRDRANRTVLERQQGALEARQRALDEREAYLRSMIAQGRGGELYPGIGNTLGAALAELETIEAERRGNADKLAGLSAVENRIDAVSGQRAYLIGLSTDGNGRAIVSVGNPDTADNVATYVPGTGSRLRGGVSGDLHRVDAMAEDAGRVAAGERTAVVLWLGYDAPQSVFPEAAQGGYAADAAPDLRRFQDGLRATHEGTAAHQTVLGHSYGTTVVGYAAAGGSLNADDIVFVASPGVGVDHASDLHLTDHGSAEGHVYATTAEHDIIAKAGGFRQLVTELIPGPHDNRVDGNPTDPRYLIHGQSPVDGDFGATVFASDPGSITHPLDAHGEYWDKGNIGRDGMATIIVGDGATLRPRPSPVATPSPSPVVTPSPAPGPAPTTPPR